MAADATAVKADPHRSARLIFRAAESPQDDAFFQSINADPYAYQNSNTTNIVLPGSARAKQFQQHVINNALLGAVICLPASAPIPIDCIVLSQLSADMAHHRHTVLGIDILEAYRGQGYGSEAIRWVLRWAFRRAGLHRVQACTFGWNEGALKLYPSLGFIEEGRWREFLWHEGRFWDEVQFGILDREWEEMQKQQENGE